MRELNATDGVDDASIKQNYELNADYWIDVVREGRDPYQKDITDPALLAAIGDPAGLEFVDAGCGEGFFARLLIERGARHVYGIDVSDALITAATTHPDADSRTSTFYRGDVGCLPLPDACADIVYANRLPHGFADPGRRFAEFARVLRPGGRFVHLSLHPCFYVARQQRNASGIAAADYFAGRTIVQEFEVGGQTSPAPSVQRFYSLETYCRMMFDSGFVITNLAEPRPRSLDERTTTSFPTPLFLLITARLAPAASS